MFEPLEAVGQTGGQTHLLGRHVLGRHASTLFGLDFGVWILDFSFFFSVLWDVMGNPMNGTEKKRKNTVDRNKRKT